METSPPTNSSHPAVLSTLAAAYADAGIWDKAIDATHQAVEQAKRAKKPELGRRLEVRIPLFKSKRPYRNGMGTRRNATNLTNRPGFAVKRART